MKHVWMLNHYALEPCSPGGTRHFHLAERLPDYGWTATIIAASVVFTNGRQRLNSNEKRRIEEYRGVPFVWIHTPKYKGNGSGRMANMLVYSLRSLLPRFTRDLKKPDLIIGSSVHPFAALSGALLAKRHRVPFIFEVRDLWPLTLISMGRLKKKSIMDRILGRLELWLYQQASNIVVLLPRAVEYIQSLGISMQKVTWIPNGVDLSLFSNNCASEKKRNPFVLMYFGSHGEANCLDVIIRAMNRISNKVPKGSVKLRMIGDGPLKPELIRLSKRLKIYSEISFESSVPKSEIPALASQADAFVLTVLDQPQLYQYGISMNKLFDYLAAGRPVLMASNAINNPVQEAGAGLVLPPNDPDALADAILKVYRTPDREYRRMSQAGRLYVEKHHGFDLLAKKLAVTMNRCLL